MAASEFELPFKRRSLGRQWTREIAWSRGRLSLLGNDRRNSCAGGSEKCAESATAYATGHSFALFHPS